MALEEARRAYQKGEVPVGAVLVIKEACEKIGFWRLDNSYLYTTVEPCVMCSGAIVQARVENVIYGAADVKYGCCGSCIDLVANNKFNHQAHIISGVLEEECAALMKDFFRELRDRKK